MKKLFWIAFVAYALAWTAHLIVATHALRGFFADGALAFLINVSQSYVFNQNSRWVHLFVVGFPRDAQLFLNALGIQAALLFGVTNALTLKYTFVFWQFALPGFLYLITLALLVHYKRASWAIFPLVSWAILSVPVDWNAVNSTRWAIPIFWMHTVLVLFAGPKLKFWPSVAAIILAITMLGGLYESVVLQAGLCLIFGVAIWFKTKNRTPFVYATAAIPGAARAVISYLASGHTAPNGFHMSLLSNGSLEPLFVFTCVSLAFIALIALCSPKSPTYSTRFFTMAVVLVGIGVIILDTLTYEIWWQANQMRFWYVVLSSGLMALAFGLRFLRLSPEPFALPVATLSLIAGTFLWIAQVEQTTSWQACITAYDQNKGEAPLILGEDLAPLVKPNSRIGLLDRGPYGECLWDWTVPWGDLLRSPSGRITQWSLFTFWQDFSFIKKQGTVYLHTNNWTLTSPSMQLSSADLPLKTLLYDLTPLYEKIGEGPFINRTHCVDPDQSGDYWRAHLNNLDNDRRRSMFVCPIGSSPQ